MGGKVDPGGILTQDLPVFPPSALTTPTAQRLYTSLDIGKLAFRSPAFITPEGSFAF